jgi:hypothetical protein
VNQFHVKLMAREAAHDLLAGAVWLVVAVLAFVQSDWGVCGCSLAACVAHLELWRIKARA